MNTVGPTHVQAWVDSAAEALNHVSISPGDAPATKAAAPKRLKTRTATVSDDEDNLEEDDADASGRPLRRRPSQRDSLRRREALLKGNEGSRRRQRWENDRLIGNPHAQPPLPSDWEVHPTYPRHVVPYFLAPLWDRDTAARRDAEQQRAAAAKYQARIANEGGIAAAGGHVPKDLRQSLKRARAARGLLQELEEEVRRFVAGWEAKKEARHNAGLNDADSDDEEVVFVGRGGVMHDMPPSPKAKSRRGTGGSGNDALVFVGRNGVIYDTPPSPTESRHSGHEDVQREKLVYGGLEHDRQAAFGRWLVHSIADYYGLRAWSVTRGDPPRREAYVGIHPAIREKAAIGQLPRPLWGRV